MAGLKLVPLKALRRRSFSGEQRGRDSITSRDVQSPRLCPDLVPILVPPGTLVLSQGDLRITMRASLLSKSPLTPLQHRKPWSFRWSALVLLMDDQPFPSGLPLTVRCRSQHWRGSFSLLGERD
ncbi:hypothetical protein PO909_006408 [Leuciscus waleckii]